MSYPVDGAFVPLPSKYLVDVVEDTPIVATVDVLPSKALASFDQLKFGSVGPPLSS